MAADCRRRYAGLRRRLLIDPHLPKDASRSPDLVNDNPLSQNPDSTWGQFFRNAELEKMLDQDLSRLYPEHCRYFQTPACQAMLRRILLLWCVRHPEYGYRQGMHELVAPLLYVLHVDLHYLSQVQGQYGDYFSDEFDETPSPCKDLVSNYRFSKTTTTDAGTDDEGFQESKALGSLDELDSGTRDMYLLSDAYGAEGELGIIISERFMEHDAYCMFESLMNGARGVVAMADFFSPSPAIGSNMGVPPVIEASSALYHLLSVVDSPLHRHLVDLGVEPQYFALRWLRVLFGREFSLDDLLGIWDELFSSPNSECIVESIDYSFRILCCHRGAFIAAMAVSMLVHVRSSLFATETATSCLQRLLNYPTNVSVKKLIEKARSLQALAVEMNISLSSSQGSPYTSKLAPSRIYSLPSSLAPPSTPPFPVPDSYWEEKWRVLHREEALNKENHGEKKSDVSPKGSLVQRFGLSRTGSAPVPGEITNGIKDARAAVRRRLLDNLLPEVESGEALGKRECDRDHDLLCSKQSLPVNVDVGKHFPDEPTGQSVTERTSNCRAEEICSSSENSSEFSTATSSHSVGNDDENDSEKSSVTSNSSVADNDEEIGHVEEPHIGSSGKSGIQDSETASTSQPGSSTDGAVQQEAALKETKPLYGKFQWLLQFGRGNGEGNTVKGGNADRQILSHAGKNSKDAGGPASNCNSSRDSGRVEVGDKKVTGTLKNLGQSMLDNIQVIESILQQDRGQSGNTLGGKGQVTAMSALTELRKISNLLSEM